MRVPAECFYVRFGSFANFLWLQDTLEKWGGDAQNLVALRGLDHDMSGRIERQLILKHDVLAPHAGRYRHRRRGDHRQRHVLPRRGRPTAFSSKPATPCCWARRLTAQRASRLKAGGVTEEKVKIGGREVSFISSRDGSVAIVLRARRRLRVRHLVEKTRRAVFGDRRKETRTRARRKGSLGASAEFRYARTIMPLSRGDTVFVYLSDAFFRNITSPHYRVEMARRLQSVADIELVQLAKLAAAERRQAGRFDRRAHPGQLSAAELRPLARRQPDGPRRRRSPR